MKSDEGLWIHDIGHFRHIKSQAYCIDYAHIQVLTCTRYERSPTV